MPKVASDRQMSGPDQSPHRWGKDAAKPPIKGQKPVLADDSFTAASRFDRMPGLGSSAGRRDLEFDTVDLLAELASHAVA